LPKTDDLERYSCVPESKHGTHPGPPTRDLPVGIDHVHRVSGPPLRSNSRRRFHGTATYP